MLKSWELLSKFGVKTVSVQVTRYYSVIAMQYISINRADTKVFSTVKYMQVISVLRCESCLEVDR
jgi:hypothetical protein